MKCESLARYILDVLILSDSKRKHPDCSRWINVTRLAQSLSIKAQGKSSSFRKTERGKFEAK